MRDKGEGGQMEEVDWLCKMFLGTSVKFLQLLELDFWPGRKLLHSSTPCQHEFTAGAAVLPIFFFFIHNKLISLDQILNFSFMSTNIGHVHPFLLLFVLCRLECFLHFSFSEQFASKMQLFFSSTHGCKKKSEALCASRQTFSFLFSSSSAAASIQGLCPQ